MRGFAKFSGGQIWLHDPDSQGKGSCAWRQVKADREPLPGRLLSVCQKSVVFDGRAVLHGTELFSRHCVMLIAYSLKGVHHAPAEKLAHWHA